MSPPASSQSFQPSLPTMYAIVGLTWLLLFSIAATGYPDLVDNEKRVGGYVLDAVQNGHWVCQHDQTGDIASKPPLLTWMACLVVLVTGKLSAFAVHLPSALGTLGAAFVILAAGRAYFGWLAGFLGALCYLLSLAAANQVVTARYDGLFAFPVALGAVAAFRAWQTGRGWISFWLVAAVATMVKGPLGLVLAGGGLLAAVWEWRSGKPLRLRGSQIAGVLVYLLIPGTWFALAYASMGQPLIDKMIGRELVGHVLEARDESGPGGAFWMPTVEVVVYFLPWTAFAAIAFWRVVKQPSRQDETRRFERFLFCWFFFGLALFSIAAHQSGRLIFPLIPAAALLTGRELADRAAAWQPARLFRLILAVWLSLLGLVILYFHFLAQWEPHAKDTSSLKNLAQTIRTQVGAQFPLTYVDTPYAIQFSLNTLRRWVSCEQAASLLRGGEDAAFVMVRDFDKLQETLGTNAPPLHELLSAPLVRKGMVRLVSNHPRLEWTDHMATSFGPVSLRMSHVRLMYASERELVFEPLSSAGTGNLGTVTIANISDEQVKLRVRTKGDHPDTVEDMVLAPGDARQMSIR